MCKYPSYGPVKVRSIPQVRLTGSVAGIRYCGPVGLDFDRATGTQMRPTKTVLVFIKTYKYLGDF